MKYVIIQGSARSHGNTNQIATIFGNFLGAEIIDLKTRNIHPYDYEHIHQDDDFLPLMRKLVQFDTLILITPVYWYTMSGRMKIFFDRFTDCLKVEKELGRKLRGRNMIAVSCGSDEVETEGFFIPFRDSAGYLGMNYVGDVHTWVAAEKPGPVVIKRIEGFIRGLNL